MRLAPESGRRFDVSDESRHRRYCLVRHRSVRSVPLSGPCRSRSDHTRWRRRWCSPRWRVSRTRRSASCAGGSRPGWCTSTRWSWRRRSCTATPRPMRMISFGVDEHPRSLQLYGSDPQIMGQAVHKLCDAGRVDHIDINFGCPAAKVTRRGGGAAVPARPELLRAILRAAVSNASPYGVPVTAKFRMGLFDDWLTHIRTGEVCAEEGVAVIALHARTVAAALLGRGPLGRDRRAEAGRRIDPGTRQRRHLGGRRRRADDGRHRMRRRRDRPRLPRTSVAVRRPRRGAVRPSRSRRAGRSAW